MTANWSKKPFFNIGLTNNFWHLFGLQFGFDNHFCFLDIPNKKLASITQEIWNCLD